MTSRRIRGVVLSLLLSGLAAQQGAVAAHGTATLRQDAAVQMSVSEWLAWRVFHDSLQHYVQRSSDQLERVLSHNFGLNATEGLALLAAGRNYLQAIQAIDANARTEVQNSYGTDRPVRPSSTGVAAALHPEKPIALAAGKRLLATVQESGLYARVETAKVQQLASHVATLRRVLGQAKFARVEDTVRRRVTEKIKVWDRGAPATITRPQENGKYATR